MNEKDSDNPIPDNQTPAADSPTPPALTPSTTSHLVVKRERAGEREAVGMDISILRVALLRLAEGIT